MKAHTFLAALPAFWIASIVDRYIVLVIPVDRHHDCPLIRSMGRSISGREVRSGVLQVV